MAHVTTINSPHALPSSVRGAKEQPFIVLAVMAAIIGAILGFLYLTYRAMPETGVPGKLDQAQGVSPQYPPATPAQPW